MYSTYLTGTSGSSQTDATALAVDATGRAYVAGNTDALDFPTTAGSAFANRPGSAAGFVVKLNNAGSGLTYSSYLPGTDIRGIALDAAGAAYVAGGLNVWKVNASGTALDYTATVGGAGGGQPDQAQAIAVDASGHAYVAGLTYAPNNLATTPGAFQTVFPNTTRSGFPSGYVVKLDPTGAGPVYRTFLGTGGWSQIHALAVDASGNAYLAGRMDNSASVPNFGTVGSITQDTQHAGNDYAFAAKLNAAGTQLAYFTRYGGSYCQNMSCGAAATWANAIALDGNGNAWITGPTRSNQLPLVKPLVAQFTAQGNGPDLYVAKLNTAGNGLLFATLLGGTTAIQPSLNGLQEPRTTGLAVDAVGSVYVAGATNRSDFPTTTGAFQTTLSGSAGTAGFVVKINESKDTSTTLAVSPMSGAVGTSFTLTASVTGNTPNPSGSVGFYDGGSLLGSAPLTATPPHTAQYTTSQLPAGTRSLTAVYAGDAGHRPSTSAAQSINISDPDGIPTVVLTGQNGLTDGQSLTANSGSNYTGGQVSVTANAAPGNTLNEVRITRVLTDTWVFWTPQVPSFSSGYALPSLPVGLHIYHATVTDNYNHTVTSAPIRFVVNPATATPPAIALTAPANGATVTAPGPIAFTVTATPAGGNTIASVTYYQGSTAIGSSTTAPYGFTWSNVAAGTYSLVALAVDNTGARTLSAPVTVTVTPPLGVPGAPTLVTATPGAGSATLTFTAPASNGGAAITGFTGTCTASGQTTATATAAASATSVTITNLTGGVGYNCTVAATNSFGTGAASNSLSVTPTAAPAIAITAPANNASVGSANPLDIVVTAQVAPNTIAKVGIFDGATLLTTFTPTGQSSVTATYTWTGMTVGNHTLTAKVTDSQGNTGTSAAVTVQVVASASISLNTLSNFYLAGSTVDLNTVASAAGSATIAKVEFFADNGSTNTPIGTVTTAPYNFRWANVAAGSYIFTAKVTDSQMLATTSAPVSVTVGNAVTIQFAAGLNGSTVDDDAVLVSGTTTAPPNSAVSINGQLATVTREGQFFMNDLNLQAGANTVTATVTTQDGQTANQAIAINRSTNPALFSVSVTPNGIATQTSPFVADITVANPNNTPFATITVVCSDPGPGVAEPRLAASA